MCLPSLGDHRAVDAVEEVLRKLEAGEFGDPLPVVAYLAGRGVEIPERELAEAQRRALLLLAAGGDPHREPSVDDRAVKAIAVDLHTGERLRALAGGLDALALAARELPRVRAAVLFLVADVELAWRIYAVGLLVEGILE